jgi:hypothetical protein
LALWLVVLFAPHVAGPVLSRIIVKPTAVPDAGPTWLLLTLFVPYAAAYFFATRRPEAGDLAVIGVFSAVFCVALVARYLPLASYDLFLYVFQGRAVAFHGLNPYAFVPAAITDPFVAAMGQWLSGLKDTYGPLWTSFAAMLAAAIGDRPAAQVVAFKAFVAAFFLACVPVVAAIRAAVATGPADAAEDAGAMLLFAWNPALLFELVQNGHNDAVMVFFLLAAILLALRGRLAWAGTALAASFLIKYITLLCVPFFVAYAVSRADAGARRRMAAAATLLVPAAVLTIVAYAPYWFGLGTLDGLFHQSSLAGIDISSPLAFAVAFAIAGGTKHILTQAVINGAAKPALLAFAAAAVLLTAAAFRRRVIDDREFVRFAFAPLICYLAMVSFWFMPWYLSWIVPLAVVEGAALVSLVSGVTGILLYYSYFAGPLLALAVAVTAAASAVASRFAASRSGDSGRKI